MPAKAGSREDDSHRVLKVKTNGIFKKKKDKSKLGSFVKDSIKDNSHLLKLEGTPSKIKKKKSKEDASTSGNFNDTAARIKEDILNLIKASLVTPEDKLKKKKKKHLKEDASKPKGIINSLSQAKENVRNEVEEKSTVQKSEGSRTPSSSVEKKKKKKHLKNDAAEAERTDNIVKEVKGNMNNEVSGKLAVPESERSKVPSSTEKKKKKKHLKEEASKAEEIGNSAGKPKGNMFNEVEEKSTLLDVKISDSVEEKKKKKHPKENLSEWEVKGKLHVQETEDVKVPIPVEEKKKKKKHLKEDLLEEVKGRESEDVKIQNSIEEKKKKKKHLKEDPSKLEIKGKLVVQESEIVKIPTFFEEKKKKNKHFKVLSNLERTDNSNSEVKKNIICEVKKKLAEPESEEEEIPTLVEIKKKKKKHSDEDAGKAEKSGNTTNQARIEVKEKLNVQKSNKDGIQTLIGERKEKKKHLKEDAGKAEITNQAKGNINERRQRFSSLDSEEEIPTLVEVKKKRLKEEISKVEIHDDNMSQTKENVSQLKLKEKLAVQESDDCEIPISEKKHKKKKFKEDGTAPDNANSNMPKVKGILTNSAMGSALWQSEKGRIPTEKKEKPKILMQEMDDNTKSIVKKIPLMSRHQENVSQQLKETEVPKEGKKTKKDSDNKIGKVQERLVNEVKGSLVLQSSFQAKSPVVKKSKNQNLQLGINEGVTFFVVNKAGSNQILQKVNLEPIPDVVNEKGAKGLMSGFLENKRKFSDLTKDGTENCLFLEKPVKKRKMKESKSSKDSFVDRNRASQIVVSDPNLIPPTPELFSKTNEEQYWESVVPEQEPFSLLTSKKDKQSGFSIRTTESFLKKKKTDRRLSISRNKAEEAKLKLNVQKKKKKNLDKQKKEIVPTGSKKNDVDVKIAATIDSDERKKQAAENIGTHDNNELAVSVNSDSSSHVVKDKKKKNSDKQKKQELAKNGGTYVDSVSAASIDSKSNGDIEEDEHDFGKQKKQTESNAELSASLDSSSSLEKGEILTENVNTVKHLSQNEDSECDESLFKNSKADKELELDEIISSNDSVFSSDEEESPENEEMLPDMKWKLSAYEVVSKNKFVLHLHHPCNFGFYGRLRITYLTGNLEIFGFSLNSDSTVKTIDYYSPRFFTTHYIETKEVIKESNLIDVKPMLLSLIRECDIETIMNEFSPNDSLILVEPIGSDFAKVINKYIEKPLFPQRPITRGSLSYVADCLECNFTLNQLHRTEFQKVKEWDSLPIDKHIAVFGGQNSGKSTLVKYLINRSLSIHEAVLCLDFDPGQSECTPPGCISATVIRKPLFGPNFTHILQPERMVCFGDVNVASNPTKYLECVENILQFCRESPELSKIPWFVNTMGYTKGLGLALTITLLKLLRPDAVAQIISSNNARNFSTYLTPKLVQFRDGFQFRNLENAEYSYEFAVVPSCSEKRIITGTGFWKPFRLRTLISIAYFSQMLSPVSPNFNAVQPYVISFSNLYLVVSSAVSPNHILKAFNGNMVALCHFEEEIDSVPQGEITEAVMQENDYFKIVVKPNVMPCLGFGFIRGIDCERKKFYVITHLKSGDIEAVNCLMVTNLTPPAAIYLKQDTVQGPVAYTNINTSRNWLPVKRTFNTKNFAG